MSAAKYQYETSLSASELLEEQPEALSSSSSTTFSAANTPDITPTAVPGFGIGEKGLYVECRVGKKGVTQWQWVCSSIEVIACTRYKEGGGWGRMVRFADLDGCMYTKEISMEALLTKSHKCFALLADWGLRINTKRSIRQSLLDYIQDAPVRERTRLVDKTGWHGEYFILPGAAVPEEGQVCLKQEINQSPFYQVQGSLEEWQEKVAKRAQESSALMLALASAFTAPLLADMGEITSGFHIIEDETMEKSSILATAASVWGNPAFMATWDDLKQHPQHAQQQYNHTLLCVSTLAPSQRKDAHCIASKQMADTRTAYMLLTSGVSPWNVAGTGEESAAYIYDISAKGMEIPYMHSNTHCYYGTASRAFLAKYAEYGKHRVQSTIEQEKKDFLNRYAEDITDPAIQLAAQRFALVAASGELAVKWGILPYAPSQLSKEIAVCFKAWQRVYVS